ncbi:MAG TPA: ABC transporter ATP-binding protein [Kiritimatiellia bacterium]|jgi:ABC-type lipoprotein export system ATPase subunit|nr:ABC transporter ATP-binding protein [Kiritimatiellia bacterium]OQC59382.1 MAG: Lipoprotein-releasing system ATP-binding protein LolD [Verrucomicrobia bacterium ADurb.Bin018]MBP9572215.1 ABC transporter ATP-binding protein [Kiritimatiellia bacterium]HOE00503.1 ABC transporter ATP-binding protein [Kiritimatiellia bacterium]HOE37003.1 ABC transporter ATP-binding protein [Kiritimatiellia bacterium]
MSNDILIAGRNLQRHYRRGSEIVRALDGVDLEIRAGESVCILGPSGSGKTTLVNLLSALDVPTAGELEIGGRRVDGLSEAALVDVRRGMLGYVFQQFHLIPTLTVMENIALPLLFLRRKVDPAELLRVLEAVGLADRAKHLPKELSGGQMQRVAIGRALVVRPRVLIADEPTGNLDSHTGEAIFTLFQKTVREDGVALVLTTHNLALAARCDRTLTLTDGKIVGTTAAGARG